MKAPVGLLSDRTVLRSKMEGLCPDKFPFAVLVPSRIWGKHALELLERILRSQPDKILE